MRRPSLVLAALLVLASVTPAAGGLASAESHSSAAAPDTADTGMHVDAGTHVDADGRVDDGRVDDGRVDVGGHDDAGRFVDAAPSSPTSAPGVARVTPGDATAAATVGAVDDPTPARARSTGRVATEIELRTTLGLTPDRPGEITVTHRFSLPRRVSALSTTLPTGARVVSTAGFTAGARENEYEWDGRDATPTVTYRLPANRTATSGRLAGDRLAENGTRLAGNGTVARAAGGADTAGDAPARTTQGSGGYLFTDVGEWALVTTPSPGVQWRYSGQPLALNRTTTVAGEGAVGNRMAFLGAHETHVRRAHGQTFRLVVPAAADMAADPASVLDSLAAASGALRVGDRDASVFVVAAPAGPDWAVRGLQTGDADAWVGADEPLDVSHNAWLHEYVHTRQGFEVTASARWVIEGSADYYAALLTFRQERIEFDDFADELARGAEEPYGDAVLADPATWEGDDGMGAQYLKGALVAGELDRRTRLATDGGGTLASVLARLNGRREPVTAGAFLDAVETVGGESVADAAARYTRTSAAPEMWTRAAHREAFGRPLARVAFTPAAAVGVSGPYRNDSLPAPLSLATGETLTLRTRAENVGTAAGGYLLTLRIDGEPADATTGRLDPGDRTTVRLSHTFDAPGVHTVSVAGRSYRVRVREPADPALVAVRANRTAVGANASVRVTATVRNDASVPAADDLPVRVDGRRVATLSARLAPNETRKLSVVVRLQEPGERRVSVGDRGVTVTVAAEGDEVTPVTTPGYGPVAALAGVVSLALLCARRFRRRPG